MSLVSSTAFQYSPAVQARAFITLGTLAISDVDDDLFYQMIVALKKVLSETKQSDTDLCMILSMLRCFSKLVPSLTVGSRFFPQLFWLGVALLQTGIMGLFIEAAELLKVTLENMMSQGMFDERGVSSTLLQERTPMEEVSVQLDHMLSLSFDSSFSFSLAAILFKGMRHQGLKEAASGALRSLLKITTQCKGGEGEMPPDDTIYYDSLGYFLALIPLSTTRGSFKILLEDANTNLESSKELKPAKGRDLPQAPLTLLGISDPTTALLSTAFISSVLTTAQIDSVETEVFYHILSDIGDKYPEVIALA
jgi:neurofibromin 1